MLSSHEMIRAILGPDVTSRQFARDGKMWCVLSSGKHDVLCGGGKKGPSVIINNATQRVYQRHRVAYEHEADRSTSEGAYVAADLSKQSATKTSEQHKASAT